MKKEKFHIINYLNISIQNNFKSIEIKLKYNLKI
jgi:hypothetical protein